MKIHLSTTGGADLAKRLSLLPQSVSKAILREALKKAGAPMAKRMSQLAPRAPGAPDLADNIGMSSAQSVEGTRLPSTAAGIAIGPTKDFFYGRFLELGTVKMPARPFMRPAFDTTVHQALSLFTQEIWIALRKKSQISFVPTNTGGGRTL